MLLYYSSLRKLVYAEFKNLYIHIRYWFWKGWGYVFFQVAKFLVVLLVFQSMGWGAVCFWWTEVCTQDLVFEKQGFYCLNHTSNLFCSGYFADGFYWSIYLGWPQIVILLISVSEVARIIGISHQHTTEDKYLNWVMFGLKSKDHCFQILGVV
jgi:hypothetical protein